MTARTDHARILRAEFLAAVHLGRAALTSAGGRPPATGQSVKHALNHLRSIPGLTDATVDVNERVGTATVHVSVDAGWTVADPAALINFLVLTAWSLNGFRPDTLTVFVDSDPGTDLLAAAGSFPQAFGDETIVMIPTVHLGEWPGAVHYLDDDVIGAA